MDPTKFFDQPNQADHVEIYRAASQEVFTPAELAQASANFAFGAKRWPEEHARSALIIEEKQLGNHREVIDWYLKYKAPIPPEKLSEIQLFQHTTYAGPFGKGEQYEAPRGPGGAPRSMVNRGAPRSLVNGGPVSLAERVYRKPALKPDGTRG